MGTNDRRGSASTLRALLVAMCALVCVAFAFAQDGVKKDARYYEQQAVNAYREKNYSAYLENMKQASALRPDHPRILYNLAGAHALAGDKTEAVKLLARVASMGLYYPAEKDTDFASIKDTAEFKTAHARFASSRDHTGQSAQAFVLKEKGLITESVAYDPADETFYVSSAYRRKILSVNRRGEVKEFATEREGLLSALGMKVDARRRHLWVAPTPTS